MDDATTAGKNLGLLEAARGGLVNKIKVRNTALQDGGGIGGGVTGLIGGLGLGAFARRLGLLKRMVMPVTGMMGGIAGRGVGRAAGSLAGTNIPAAVDQPMTPETIAAVSQFINKQAKIRSELNKIASRIPGARRGAIKVAIAAVAKGHSLESALAKAYPSKSAAVRLSWADTIKTAAETQ